MWAYLACGSKLPGISVSVSTVSNDGPMVSPSSVFQVFAVKHKPSGVRLALKRINVGEDQQMQHIKRELDALYMDGNDHIINFYGAFFDRGNIMIALGVWGVQVQRDVHGCMRIVCVFVCQAHQFPDDVPFFVCRMHMCVHVFVGGIPGDIY